MNNAPSWEYTRPRLSEALAAWKATGVTPEMEDAVEAALMDLIENPTEWGTEDPDQPGVYQRSIQTDSGVRIGILYAIPERGRVGVADIRTGS